MWDGMNPIGSCNLLKAASQATIRYQVTNVQNYYLV